MEGKVVPTKEVKDLLKETDNESYPAGFVEGLMPQDMEEEILFQEVAYLFGGEDFPIDHQEDLATYNDSVFPQEF